MHQYGKQIVAGEGGAPSQLRLTWYERYNCYSARVGSGEGIRLSVVWGNAMAEKGSPEAAVTGYSVTVNGRTLKARFKDWSRALLAAERFADMVLIECLESMGFEVSVKPKTNPTPF